MLLKKLKFGKNKKIIKNRIIVSPMCQYSSDNGAPSQWHYRHLANLMLSGSGMIMVESTAVTKQGMISKKDLCIETTKQKKKFKKLLIYLKKINNTPIGIQLLHSGRKGSSEIPWIKTDTPLKKKDGWETISASNLSKDTGWPKPKRMSLKDITTIIKDYKKSVINAKFANFDILELHMAHGYFIHQFLSPISNKRKDIYGGSKKNRLRLAIEIAKAVRKNWPKNKILGARITATDHLLKGIDIKDSIDLCKQLDIIGFDYVCVSSGGIKTKTNRKFKNFFRANYAKKIKAQTNLKIGITGLTHNFEKADKFIKKKFFDFIFVGKPFLGNPFFLYQHKYIKKRKFKILPIQYQRSFY